MADDFEVAVVGGGPAGAALAIKLARLGVETVVLERRRTPAWRASGVFSSPLTRDRLRNLDFAEAEVAALHRPIRALDLESVRGAHCHIEYTDGFACGFDRLALETSLLDRARSAGAQLWQGTVVREVVLSTGRGTPGLLKVSSVADDSIRGVPPARRELSARIVVGADGSTALVSRAAGTYRTHRFMDRAGITFHRADPSAADPGAPMDGRFVFGDGWYAGIAPVPQARVNVGIVVPAMRGRHPAEIGAEVVARMPGQRANWMSAATTDEIVTVGRLEHHSARAAGLGWLLVGDAIGFVDPLTGEGILRALTSAEMAAEAITRNLLGDRGALDDYDRRIRRKFAGKNVVSWMLQLFLARPAVFDYALRRLSARADLREELTLVLTDQSRASHVINPGFVARLLRP